MAYSSLISRVKGSNNGIVNRFINIAFKAVLFDYCAQASIERNPDNPDIVASSERKQQHCQQIIQDLQVIAEAMELNFDDILTETQNRFDKYIEKKEANS